MKARLLSERKALRCKRPGVAGVKYLLRLRRQSFALCLHAVECTDCWCALSLPLPEAVFQSQKKVQLASAVAASDEPAVGGDGDLAREAGDLVAFELLPYFLGIVLIPLFTRFARPSPSSQLHSVMKYSCQTGELSPGSTTLTILIPQLLFREST